MLEVSNSSSNRLLAALNSPASERLNLHSQEVTLVQGQILHQRNQAITEIYFPLKAAISLTIDFEDGSLTEVAIVGNEGVIGLPILLGDEVSCHQAIVQVPGKAIKVASKVVEEEFRRGEEFQRLILRYAQAQINQISQIAACQTHHLIEQRLARWLLLMGDVTGENTLPITQKLISTMLGVRRASVTEAAIALQKAGAIAYSRGQITITDPSLLKTFTCECYEKIQQDYKRLLGFSS